MSSIASAVVYTKVWAIALLTLFLALSLTFFVSSFKLLTTFLSVGQVLNFKFWVISYALSQLSKFFSKNSNWFTSSSITSENFDNSEIMSSLLLLLFKIWIEFKISSLKFLKIISPHSVFAKSSIWGLLNFSIFSSSQSSGNGALWM